MNLPVTSVPTCVISNVKTLALQHLELPDMAASSEPPDRTYAIRHKLDELLTKRQTVSDGQAISLPKKKEKHAQSLGCTHS
jgi:hypothetical protein